MKRTHTQDPERYAHHERASVADRISRAVRKAMRPAKLALIAWQAQRSDETYAALVDLQDSVQKALRREAHKRVAISARRQAIQRGVA